MTVDLFLKFVGSLAVFYCILSYMVGLALFLVELKRSPKELLPFGILLLVLSPFTAPNGVCFYSKHYLSDKKKPEEPLE